MEHFEKQAISSAGKKQTRWYRYVDDTFVVWPHGKDELHTFLKHLNSIHQKIAFTMKVEKTRHSTVSGRIGEEETKLFIWALGVKKTHAH
jgi:hypothetical protein